MRNFYEFLNLKSTNNKRDEFKDFLKDLDLDNKFDMNQIEELINENTEEIKKHIPEFSISYKPDFRQAIADSWPQSIDDTEARKDWGWKEKYDLPKLVENMIANLGKTVAA